MKGSATVEAMSPRSLTGYANLCAWTLARAVTDFSQRYADQNERDYEAFVGAVRSGRLHALEGV
jgi:hypothetical protein